MARLFFFSIFLLCNTALIAFEHELAVCTIFKDCSPYLKEWIEYHRLVGVEHFYLYDNSSHDHPKRILKKYIDKGIVTLIHWPNRNQESWGDRVMAWVDTTQLPAYQHGCHLAKTKVKWLAFIDSDEFLVPMSSLTLKELLAAHEEAPGICLNWAVYGTSGVYDIPANQLMIELLTKRARLDDPINRHTKSIVKPTEFNGWSWAPHAAHYRNEASPYLVPMDEARVNHYINRTVKFFYEHKIDNKERMDNVTWDEERTQQFLSLGNDEEDLTMERFVPKLRRKLGYD